jgi:hypothetical protein
VRAHRRRVASARRATPKAITTVEGITAEGMVAVVRVATTPEASARRGARTVGPRKRRSSAQTVIREEDSKREYA